MSLENVEDIYPLTPMQHLMLMHSLRAPGSSTLINQFRYTLRGPFEQTRFVRAWEQVVSRHQALRTAFVWEGVPNPLQVVRTQVTVPLEFIDLRDQSDTNRNARTEEILSNDRVQGFDLRRAPLLRLRVIRLHDEEYLLILSRNHLILDLWSIDIVFNEVFRAYQSPDCLEQEPAGRFRSYLDWLAQQNNSEAEAYWRRYLDGIETPSLLFGSCAQRNQWTADGQSSVRRTIDADTTAAVSALFGRLGLTTGTLLQGVIALIVSVLTDRRDVIFGLTVSSRPAEVADVEHIVGSFINNVPVRTRIDDEMSIRTWLQQMQVAQGERTAFDYVSPTDLQRWSNIGANTGLFDLLLLLQSPPATTTTIDSLVIEAMPGPLDSALPMTLAIESGPEGFILTAVHDSAIVPDQVANAIIESVAAAITGLADGVPEHVGDLRQSIAQSIPGHLLPRTSAEQVDVETQASTGNAIDESSDAAILLNIFRHSIGNPDVGLDDDFFALGGTSIQAAMAFTEIEQQFGRTMPLSILFSAGSVRNLMAALELPPAPSSSLISIQGFGNRPPIIAISGIGGNVVGLANVARVLGHDQPFFGLQSKALEGDQLPINTIEAIAEEYIAECAQQRRGPYVLLGVCFGANVAVEMAHQLRGQGQAPELVIVLDPSVDEEETSSVVTTPSEPSTLGFVVERVRLLLKTFLEKQGEERRLWLKEKWSVLIRKLRHRDLLHGNKLEMAQQRVEAANLAANRRYRPRPYEGMIHTLITSDRPIGSSIDPRNTWCERMQSKFQPVPIPGRDTGDALLNQAPAFAAQLRHWIDDVVRQTEKPN